MQHRSLRWSSLIALAVTCAMGSASTDASAAGKKDKDATKLYNQAMDEDYLSVEFDAAESKLQKALEVCGESNCSPEVLAKVHVALGTVRGVGMQRIDDAEEDFVNALRASSKAKLIDGLTTPELEAAFKAARAKAGTKAPKPPKDDDDDDDDGPGVSGDFEHEPPDEQAIHTPVPIYAEIPDELGASQAVIRYKPYGGQKWKTVKMRAVDDGFGGEIPCEDLTTTGEVRYYIIASDEGGTPVATAGSTRNPFKVPVRNKIKGEPPSLPGQKPPQRCIAKEDCPPGLPGCPSGDGSSRGDKGWGASCEESVECQSGLVCLNGTCEEGDDPADRPPVKGAKNLVTLGLQIDLAMLGSAERVCSTESAATHVCFEEGTSRQFYGLPLDVPNSNGISGGIGLGSVRILAGFDRLLLDDLGLAVGGRIGFALGGSPTPENSPPAPTDLTQEQCDRLGLDPGQCGTFTPQGQAKGYLPLHLEGRISYYFAPGAIEAGVPVPHVFIGGGIAQVNASVPVTVCDVLSGSADVQCPGGTRLDAYQLAGLGFIGGGGGVSYLFTDNFGAQAELKFMILLPTTGVAISPTIGPLFAF